MSEFNFLFVYGTLKSDQIRASMWPHPPLRIAPATTRGELYDLGDYPAMKEGKDLVSGEVWELRPEHMPATLEVLDAIEGYRNQPGDLYKRVAVDCELHSGETVRAFTYHYSAQLDQALRVPITNGTSEWPCS